MKYQKQRTIYPQAIHLVSNDICKEHDTPLIEVRQSNVRIDKYCPACHHRELAEANSK